MILFLFLRASCDLDPIPYNDGSLVQARVADPNDSDQTLEKKKKLDTDKKTDPDPTLENKPD